MAQHKNLELLRELLHLADIELDGPQPWDIQLHNPQMMQSVLAHGSLGFGNSYVAKDWDSNDLAETVSRILRADLPSQVHARGLWWHVIQARWRNRQTPKRAWEVGRTHYDLNNAFYSAMLGDTLAYTCGYWAKAEDLDSAQHAKLDLICRKLGLKSGQRVLDIGCGWGSFMKYAAEHFGVSCVGLTISEAQAQLGAERCAGLPIEFRLQDYRDIHEPFDHVVSVGMFEHVGRHNYHTFMDVVKRCLKPDGLCLLHTIGTLESNATPDPWLDRYIFPNGELPALAQITQAAEGRFVVEDVHNFGADYDRTLCAWADRFEAAWPQFASQFDASFYRMWRYYLLSCAGAFRARQTQLWQLVLSPQGVQGGYRRIGL